MLSKPLHLIEKSYINYTYVPDGMKLQTLKLRLVCITFYTIQQPSEIMHNLYPNSRKVFQPQCTNVFGDATKI